MLFQFFVIPVVQLSYPFFWDISQRHWVIGTNHPVTRRTTVALFERMHRGKPIEILEQAAYRLGF
jgi:hypothetical protein